MPGLYYEQADVGKTIRHRLSRTITEADNVFFCALTHNPQPLHLDVEYARKTEFGRRLVNSMLTVSLATGVSVEDTTLGTLVANLGYTDLRFPRPVFINDTLRVETEVTQRRDSKSRPDAGIVTFEHRVFNQRDEVVCTFLRTALLQKQV